MRLNFAQAVQAIGVVVGPLLASHVFFKNIKDNSLSSVQWVYLGIAIVVFTFAVIFYFSTIPEITDADMARQLELTGGVFAETENKPLSEQHHLWFSAFSQFCYMGGQVAVAGYFVNYVTETRRNTSAAAGANFLAVAQGCFAIGRFLGTFSMKWVKPRFVLFVFFTGVILFQAVATGARGDAGLASLILVLFFESICFPTIFTLGIRGLGKHTKFGSTLIVSGIFGGAVAPPMLGAAADRFNDTGPAMFVPLIFYVLAYGFPVAVIFHPPTVRIMDGFLKSKVATGEAAAKDDKVVVEHDKVVKLEA